MLRLHLRPLLRRHLLNLLAHGSRKSFISPSFLPRLRGLTFRFGSARGRCRRACRITPRHHLHAFFAAFFAAFGIGIFFGIIFFGIGLSITHYPS
jgi:hypothetical protein